MLVLHSLSRSPARCPLQDVLTPEMISRLTTATNSLLAAEPEAKKERFRSQGSMIGIPGAMPRLDTVFLDVRARSSACVSH